MTTAHSLLEVSNLGWEADGKAILQGLNFNLQAGEFVGVIGPNGAGKSSMMRCLYRVNRPAQGQILFKRQDIWQWSARENARQMAVILQEHSEHIGLTVRDIVALGLTPHKGLFERDNQQDRRQIDQVLKQLDLGAFEHAQFSRLSGGEKQRVMLARAILQKPELLIMDEPTNHLDVHYQIEILQKVKALELTVLASFHDLNLAAAFCDRLLVLENGHLVAQGAPAEVLTEDLISRVFKTCVVVDAHPLYAHPRINYAYHEGEEPEPDAHEGAHS